MYRQLRAPCPVIVEMTLEIFFHLCLGSFCGEYHQLQPCGLPSCLLVPGHELHLGFLLGAGQCHWLSLLDHAVWGLVDGTSCGERGRVEEKSVHWDTLGLVSGEKFRLEMRKLLKASRSMRLQNDPQGKAATLHPVPLDLPHFLLHCREPWSIKPWMQLDRIQAHGCWDKCTTVLCYLSCLCSLVSPERCTYPARTG